MCDRFPELKDRAAFTVDGSHRTDRNTSNMPWSAASHIYTASHRRILTATWLPRSADGRFYLRWPSLREVSGRLEEMPAEEGYLAYLANRLPNSTSALDTSRRSTEIWLGQHHWRRFALVVTFPSRSPAYQTLLSAASGRWISRWPPLVISPRSTGWTATASTCQM